MSSNRYPAAETATLIAGSDTEAAATAELARLAAIRTDDLVPDLDGVASALVRTDETWHVRSLEQYLDAPRRRRGATTVTDAASFVAQLPRSATPASTTIYADTLNGRIVAVLNDLGSDGDGVGWRDHTLVLALAKSKQWQHWTGRDGKLMRQLDFAEHVEDGLGSVAAPPAADLLEMAQSFQAKRGVDFESGTRLATGDVRFRYHETTTAQAGQKGDLDVPASFLLRLPVFEGEPAVDLTARLRYRIAESGLQIGYKLDQADELAELAVHWVVKNLREQLTGWTFVAGPAPTPVRPLD